MSDHRTPYIQCPDCGRLIHDSGWELILGDVPCPECGATCTFRTWWPKRPDVHALLELVHGQKFLQLTEQRVIATVFLATALETLFEVHLWELLKELGTQDKVAELLLDAHRGRERRISLYNQLAQRPLKEVLESAGLAGFLPAWKRLAEARNGTLHGRWKAGYEIDSTTVEYIRDNCYAAFAALHEEARRSRVAGA